MPANGHVVDYMNLGNVLVRARKLTEEQLERALEEQKRLGGGDGRNPLLGVVLVDLKLCSQADVDTALEHQEAAEPPKLEKTAKAQDTLELALSDVKAGLAKLGEATRSRTKEIKAVAPEDTNPGHAVS